MADFNTKIPIDIWRLIERYLTGDELNALQKTCHFFNHDVPYASVFLQPLYNRIRALVPFNLPAELPQNNAQSTLWLRRLDEYLFGEYLSKITEEITYLKTHHPDYFTNEVNLILEQEHLKIETLEQKSAVLDAINSHIIEKEIMKVHELNLKKTTLNISHKHISRLPTSLLRNEKYTEFWNKLKKLNCDVNPALFSLNVQSLTNLKSLQCNSSGLKFLVIRGLKNLIELNCANNKLSSLDFRGVDNLLSLVCGVNQLKCLNIHHLHHLALLSCVNNPLTCLDLKRKNNLKIILLLNCPLQELNLEEMSFEGLTLTEKNNLLLLEERLLFNQLLNCGVSDFKQKKNSFVD